MSIISSTWNFHESSSSLSSSSSSRTYGCERKIRVLVFWTPDSNHPDGDELNKLLLKQCNIIIDHHDWSDGACSKNLVNLVRVKELESSCLTTYHYRYHHHHHHHSYNDFHNVHIKFYLIHWPDCYEPKSDFFQQEFASKYFSLTHLAVGFFSSSNPDSFQYVRSWLKAFHHFHFQQQLSDSTCFSPQLYLVHIGAKNVINNGASRKGRPKSVLMDQIDDFIQHYHINFINNYCTKDLRNAHGSSSSSPSSSLGSSPSSSLIFFLRSSSFFGANNSAWIDDHVGVDGGRSGLESLFQQIIKVNVEQSI